MKTNLMWVLYIAELLAFSKTDHSAIFSKAFFEPKIIPPFHGHQVSEPHVGKLMHCHLIPLHKFKESLFLLWSHECISHNNYANILHPIDPEFRDEYHVVFLEREGACKILLKKLDSNFNSTKPFLRLSQLQLGLSAINLHWDFKTCLIGDTTVRANCKCIDVSANGRASVKFVNVTFFPKVYFV
jgi:hypothetical protein